MTSYGPMERPEPELVEAAAKFPSATLHEAMGREGALPAAIKPVASGMTVCGPAVTVQAKPRSSVASLTLGLPALEDGLGDVGREQRQGQYPRDIGVRDLLVGC